MALKICFSHNTEFEMFRRNAVFPPAFVSFNLLSAYSTSSTLISLWYVHKVPSFQNSVLKSGTLSSQYWIINPRRACAVRVTVLGLCVCVCYSTSHFYTRLFVPQTIVTFPAADEGRKILSDFLWKCFVAKLECFLLVRLRDESAIFTPQKTRMRMNLDHVRLLVIGSKYASNKGMPAV